MKYIACLLVMMVTIAACKKKDFDYKPANPKVIITATSTTADRIPAGTIRIPLRLEAVSGIEKLTVSQSIGGSAATTVAEMITFPDGLQSTIDYVYNVPANAAAGTTILVGFRLRDKNGQESDSSAVFRVNVVAAQFIRRTVTVGTTQVTEIAPVGTSTEATINEPDFTFEAGKPYLLTGVVKIQDGITVNIQSGVTIYGNTQFAPAGTPQSAVLVVSAGSKLNATGTKTAPIVFTSDKLLRGTTPAPGDHQGLVIQGNGGTDNSGTLRYIRVEWGGAKALGASSPDGAIVTQNMGSGTVMEYIQVFRSNVDGIRFIGGAPRIKYLVVTESNPANDNIRFGDGSATAEFPVWGQFWVSERATNAARAELDIRTNSNPVLMNITVTGPGFATGINNGGVRVRTSPDAAIGYRVFNSIFAQLGEGFRSQLTPVSPDLNGSRVVGHTYIFSIRGTRWRDGAATFTQAQFNNSDNIVIPGITPTSPIPTGDAPASTYNPASFNNWFTTTNFVGAVRNAANDWLSDGDWCKNTAGVIR
jgi:hypothetical protein